MTDDSARIREEIRGFIAEPDSRFGDLAVRLFRHQHAHNAPYRAYCESLGVGLTAVDSWEQVPAVPADAFKSGLPLACFPAHQAARVFVTSGTTSEVRGAHYLAELDTYALSVRNGWRLAGLPAGARAFLSRPSECTPDSSLVTMFEILASDSAEAHWLLDAGGALRDDRLAALAAASSPVTLFGTAVALRHLTETLSAPLPLPSGSWMFQTGGPKGAQHELLPGEIESLATDWFRISPDHLINEYGMTELSSQCYAVGPDTPHRTPPWMRVRVIDPESGQECAPGESGYLVFHDLANLGSVMAVRTQDFGRAVDHRTFHLDGRDPGALPRGCSRSAASAFSVRP